MMDCNLLILAILSQVISICAQFIEYAYKVPMGVARNYRSTLSVEQCYRDCFLNIACVQVAYLSGQPEGSTNCYLYFEDWQLRSDTRYTTFVKYKSTTSSSTTLQSTPSRSSLPLLKTTPNPQTTTLSDSVSTTRTILTQYPIELYLIIGIPTALVILAVFLAALVCVCHCVKRPTPKAKDEPTKKPPTQHKPAFNVMRDSAYLVALNLPRPQMQAYDQMSQLSNDSSSLLSVKAINKNKHRQNKPVGGRVYPSGPLPGVHFPQHRVSNAIYPRTQINQPNQPYLGSLRVHNVPKRDFDQNSIVSYNPALLPSYRAKRSAVSTPPHASILIQDHKRFLPPSSLASKQPRAQNNTYAPFPSTTTTPMPSRRSEHLNPPAARTHVSKVDTIDRDTRINKQDNARRPSSARPKDSENDKANKKERTVTQIILGQIKNDKAKKSNETRLNSNTNQEPSKSILKPSRNSPTQSGTFNPEDEDGIYSQIHSRASEADNQSIRFRIPPPPPPAPPPPPPMSL